MKESGTKLEAARRRGIICPPRRGGARAVICYCGKPLVHDREGILVYRQCRLPPDSCDCFTGS